MIGHNPSMVRSAARIAFMHGEGLEHNPHDPSGDAYYIWEEEMRSLQTKEFLDDLERTHAEGMIPFDEVYV